MKAVVNRRMHKIYFCERARMDRITVRIGISSLNRWRAKRAEVFTRDGILGLSELGF